MNPENDLDRIRMREFLREAVRQYVSDRTRGEESRAFFWQLWEARERGGWVPPLFDESDETIH